MRLVDADALVEKIENNCQEWKSSSVGCIAKSATNDCIKIIKSQPTVEAVPVVHGEWLNFIGDYSTAECSECGECYEVSPDDEPKAEFFELFKELYRFCPRCGARMDGKLVTE